VLTSRNSSISLNFPFFHKAQRDYTDISRELPEFIAAFRGEMVPVAGLPAKLMLVIIEAGVYYERGKLSAAEKLCERLVNFSSDYRRNADYIEALTLRAICLWRLKRTNESVAVFTDAIHKAQELELIMPIVKNGAAVLPLLQKMQNRQKYGYDADVLDKAFINLLLMRSRDISKHTPGMFSRRSRPIKLSPKQSEVVGYLVKDLSYREIGEKMGVTTTTVNHHTRVLHEKFNVSTTRELLDKVKEMGFID